MKRRDEAESSMPRAPRRGAGFLVALEAAGLLVTLTAAATAAEPPAAPPGRPELEQAEAFYSGTAGRIDLGKAHVLFEKAAAAGDPVATLRIAQLTHQGRCGFGKDAGRAAMLAASTLPTVRARASSGDPHAQFALGSVSAFGLAGKIDHANARGWWERAAAAGHPWALHNLGWMFDSGTGVPEDDARAFTFYRQAAELGNASSMLDLGWDLIRGEGTPADPTGGLAWIERAAERGLDLAQELLVNLYARGKQVPKDSAKAARWMTAMLLGGALRASSVLIDLGSSGIFSEAEVRTLRAELERASPENPHAQGTLALLLVDGWLNTTVDEARGLTLAQKAAAGGSPLGMRIIGHALFNGDGVPQDAATGVRWWLEAAAKGDSISMLWAGRSLLEGSGVRRDTALGLAWLDRAAAIGNQYAMQDLGLIYDEGRHGLPRDPAKAAEWMRKAADSGSELARGWVRYHELLAARQPRG